jgi:YesN/AraC family two-component response regulator
MEKNSEPLDGNLQVKAIPPIRLLIVDDRTPAREGLHALISVIGKSISSPERPSIIVVGEASDGAQAIKMVAQQHPEVVLMDVCMPGLNGLETMRLMKADWSDLHIILISFYGVHRTEAMEAGADEFLLKGCSPEELLQAILAVRDLPTHKESSVRVSGS